MPTQNSAADPPPTPAKNSWGLLTVLLFVALIVVGAVFIWQSRIAKEDSSSAPQNEAVIISVNSASVNEEAGDGRTILTIKNGSGYNPSATPDCQAIFNQDAADATIIYSNQTKGLSVELPYNPDWGNATYKLNPYDETDEFVAYGPLVISENCGWTRDYFIHFEPAVSAEELVASLEAKGTQAEIITFNDLAAVKYVDMGLCNYPTIEVIGQKYNYRFAPTCADLTDDGFAFLENIINTAKLLD